MSIPDNPNKGVWGGLVTFEKDGQEIIHGWYGTADMAVYVAEKLIKNKKTTGARAYSVVAVFGKYASEKAPAVNDEEPEDSTDNQPDDDPAQKTMDQWLS